jgi:type III pantothenate kinase
MNQNQRVLIFDAGNTLLKVGVFCAGKLENVVKFRYNELNSIIELVNRYDSYTIFISSVVSKELTDQILSFVPNAILFDRDIKLPIKIDYVSYNTLGIDRICNSVAINHFKKNQASVSIDIGTCIKFDFVDANGVYKGGSISPGIDLRFKSLNDYTGNLPLINDKEKSYLIGNSTVNSIKSGVLNGIQAEIDQFIFLYTEEYQDLTFFVTGGDAVYFDFPLKNNTFVDENLTLKGLYQIYVFNAL